jgi:hypothetical protein
VGNQAREVVILNPPRLRRKPQGLLDALYRGFKQYGCNVIKSQGYRSCDLLVLYGWGGTESQQAVARHRGQGDYLAWDLGYWLRDGFRHRLWRMSLNGFHPQDHIMTGDAPEVSRYPKSWKVFKSGGDPQGPILLVGNGPKSVKVVASGWSHRKAQELRRVFPGIPIWYKRKPIRLAEVGVDFDQEVDGDITRILPKVRLVVTRHSNVAIDACRMGVPVVAEDGAAACIYPRSLRDWSQQPSREKRKEFIDRLSYWQWSISELCAGVAVPEIMKRIGR